MSLWSLVDIRHWYNAQVSERLIDSEGVLRRAHIDTIIARLHIVEGHVNVPADGVVLGSEAVRCRYWQVVFFPNQLLVTE